MFELIAKEAATHRALRSADMTFIERLYAGSPVHNVPRSGRPIEQVAVSLSQQFNPQHSDYLVHSYEAWAVALRLATPTQMHTRLPTYTHLLSTQGTFPSRSQQQQ